MNINTIIENITAGGIVSVLIIVASLVEITPIKFSPLQWIGKRLNAEALLRITKMEKKLDEHIAESYRNNILRVQDKLLRGELLTREEWEKALKNCEDYEKYIKDNELSNDLVNEAMKYIHRKYQEALNNVSFQLLQ